MATGYWIRLLDFKGTMCELIGTTLSLSYFVEAAIVLNLTNAESILVREKIQTLFDNQGMLIESLRAYNDLDLGNITNKYQIMTKDGSTCQIIAPNSISTLDEIGCERGTELSQMMNRNLMNFFRIFGLHAQDIYSLWKDSVAPKELINSEKVALILILSSCHY